MVLSASDRRRIGELAREMVEIFGGSDQIDGRARTFAELEDECIEVGDAVTLAALQMRVSKGEESPPPVASCPTCHRECQPNAEDEPRVLQTDRGEVQWLEPTYHCRLCRRDFFPSGG